MKQTPLWQLVNQSLTKQENLYQYTHFLKNNRRKHQHKTHSINFKLMFLRILILIIFYQAPLISYSYFTIAYFLLKVAVLFKFTCKVQEMIEIVIMLAAFHLLDYFTKFIPFVNIVCLLANLSYFLMGIDEKFLALNLLILDLPIFNKSLIAILLGLGRVKKAPKYARLMVYIDLAFMVVFGNVSQIFFLVAMTLVVQIVQIIDQRLIQTKKNYAHIHQLPYVEQYH